MSGAPRPRHPGLGALLAGLWLLAGAATTRAAPDDGQTVLLWTHPSASELLAIRSLAARGLLPDDGLRVIGLSHAAEWEDYREAQQLLDDGQSPWIELQSVDCDLEAAGVFGRNPCEPLFARLFAESDGVVFSGGADIPPVLYGQRTSPLTVVVDNPRHRFEIAFLVRLLGGAGQPGPKGTARPAPLLAGREDYAVLGVCLGMQSLNVALGGTLLQDIPSQLYGLRHLEDALAWGPERLHRSPRAPLEPAPEVAWGVLHPIRWRAAHPLRAGQPTPDARPLVFSLHHQAIDRLAADLRVIASSLDGRVIEAVAHRRYPAVLGVQFHPEKRLLWEADIPYRERADGGTGNQLQARLQADPAARALLDAFWAFARDSLARSRAERLAPLPAK